MSFLVIYNLSNFDVYLNVELLNKCPHKKGIEFARHDLNKFLLN